MKFTKTHEWVQISQESAIIGITHHAQKALGDMVFIEFPEVGQTYVKGQELGVVESVKAASDYYAPISGTVIEINESARQNPAIVNKDPYQNGWLIKMTPKDTAQAELNTLFDKEAYDAEIDKD